MFGVVQVIRWTRGHDSLRVRHLGSVARTTQPTQFSPLPRTVSRRIEIRHMRSCTAVRGGEGEASESEWDRTHGLGMLASAGRVPVFQLCLLEQLSTNVAPDKSPDRPHQPPRVVHVSSVHCDRVIATGSRGISHQLRSTRFVHTLRRGQIQRELCSHLRRHRGAHKTFVHCACSFFVGEAPLIGNASVLINTYDAAPTARLGVIARAWVITRGRFAESVWFIREGATETLQCDPQREVIAGPDARTNASHETENDRSGFTWNG